MKAMRDEDGNFIANGHLLGFFRRICRLLFNKIRPVFVFDGATPVLKKLTVQARRQRRETQGAQVRKFVSLDRSSWLSRALRLLQ